MRIFRPSLPISRLTQNIVPNLLSRFLLKYSEIHRLTPSVIVSDFPLDFAGFFPREKSGISRGKSSHGTSREKSDEKFQFFSSANSSEAAF